MSLNVHTIEAGGQELTMRLSSKALCAFLEKHKIDGASALISVMGAIDDQAAKAALFTAALRHPGNKNTINDGNDLIDLLTDDGWGRDQLNGLVAQLAKDAGLLDAEEFMRMRNAVTINGGKMVDTLEKLLTGNREEPETTQEPQSAPDAGENPTETR